MFFVIGPGQTGTARDFLAVAENAMFQEGVLGSVQTLPTNGHSDADSHFSGGVCVYSCSTCSNYPNGWNGGLGPLKGEVQPIQNV